jgi:hypothetical protein
MTLHANEVEYTPEAYCKPTASVGSDYRYSRLAEHYRDQANVRLVKATVQPDNDERLPLHAHRKRYQVQA